MRYLELDNEKAQLMINIVRSCLSEHTGKELTSSVINEVTNVIFELITVKKEYEDNEPAII